MSVKNVSFELLDTIVWLTTPYSLICNVTITSKREVSVNYTLWEKISLMANIKEKVSSLVIYGKGRILFGPPSVPETVLKESICTWLNTEILRLDLFFEDIHPRWFVRDFLMCWNSCSRWRPTSDIKTIGYWTKFKFSNEEDQDEEENEFHVPMTLFYHLNYFKFLDPKDLKSL